MSEVTDAPVKTEAAPGRRAGNRVVRADHRSRRSQKFYGAVDGYRRAFRRPGHRMIGRSGGFVGGVSA